MRKALFDPRPRFHRLDFAVPRRARRLHRSLTAGAGRSGKAAELAHELQRRRVD
jgi:hypothetical protein